jgi:hypothetical protein
MAQGGDREARGEPADGQRREHAAEQGEPAEAADEEERTDDPDELAALDAIETERIELPSDSIAGRPRAVRRLRVRATQLVPAERHARVEEIGAGAGGERQDEGDQNDSQVA